MPRQQRGQCTPIRTSNYPLELGLGGVVLCMLEVLSCACPRRSRRMGKSRPDLTVTILIMTMNTCNGKSHRSMPFADFEIVKYRCKRWLLPSDRSPRCFSPNLRTCMDTKLEAFLCGVENPERSRKPGAQLMDASSATWRAHGLLVSHHTLFGNWSRYRVQATQPAWV